MHKVYLGGLPGDCDQPDLVRLLEEYQVRGYQGIETRRGGYAFIQFNQQQEAISAVSKLNGTSLNTS